MQTSRIIALTGLAAAVAVSTAYPTDGWGEDEDFGPIPDQLGNSSNGSNGTNTTTVTTTTVTTTITTTTTLPPYEFINFAYFMVGEAPAPPNTTTAGPVASRVGNGTTGNTTTTVTTVTTTAEPTPTDTPSTPNDNFCSINAPGQKAYYAKIGRTDCDCKAMPPPPRGWEAWDGIHWNMDVPHYQLTMATDGRAVASFHAFCDSTCTNCTVHRSNNTALPMQDTCKSQEPLAPGILDYDHCSHASDVTTESFFIRQPAKLDHMGEEFCVLVEQAAAEVGAFTVIEYPRNTDCDANGTSPLYREGAMMGQTLPALKPGADDLGECTAAYDGSYYKLYTEIDGKTNETVYDGVINCMSADAKEADLCLKDHCDYLGKVPAGKCRDIITTDAHSSYSTKLIGSGEVTQCVIPPKPSPTPTPKPSSKKGGNKGVVIGAVVAGIAVVAVVVLVIRKRRASKAQAYSVLQGSAYTEN